jgi:membrane protein implicated in regulation of membrane protease activity
MKELLTTPVIWFLVGLVLLLLELVLPGLIIVFFGIGAWIVAIAVLIFPGLSLTAQFWIFGIASVLGLILLRKFLKDRFFKQDDKKEGSLDDEFIGKKATAETDLVAGKPGKVSFKGTQWSAISDCDVEKGQFVKIVDKESITLKVTADK